jgi:hypothetical protein
MAADLARDLLNQLQTSDWDKYAGVSSSEAFKHYRGSIDVLKAIAERKCNDGCRKGGGCKTFACKIIECCQKRGFEGCWQCHKFQKCNKFEFLKQFHGEYPIENLKIIRDKGLKDWVTHRRSFYIWQE